MRHYKGKATISEVVAMPNRMFHFLYTSLVKSLSTDEGAKQAENEQIQEVMEEVGM